MKLDLSLTTKLSKNTKKGRVKKTKAKQVIKAASPMAKMMGSNAGQRKKKTSKLQLGVTSAIVCMERKKRTPLTVIDSLISDAKAEVGYYNGKANFKPTSRNMAALRDADAKLTDLKATRIRMTKGNDDE